MIETAPVELAAMPFVAAAALAAVVGFHAWRVYAWRVWKSEHRVYVGNILWPLVFAGLATFLGVWTQLGFVERSFGTLDYAIFSLLMFLCGSGTFLRRPLLRWLESLPAVPRALIRIALDVAILLIVAVASAIAVDLAWLGEGYGIDDLFFYTTVALLLAVEFMLHALGQRTGILTALVPIAAFGFGTAQHFVMLFKGTVVLPSDLLVLGTAAEVSGGYTFVLTQWIVYALCIAAACMCLLSFVYPTRAQSRKAFVTSLAVNLAVAAALGAGLSWFYNNVKLEETLDAPLNRWMPADTYQTEGFVLGFLSMAQDLAIPVPENYSDENAQALQESLASEFDATLGASQERKAAEKQFDSVKPSVVAVMNESFSDLSLHQAIKDEGYAGPAHYNSLANTIQRGTFMTSVVGGATANTEFEFLTGTATAFMGSYKYPYQLYDFTNADSLPKQFSALGYSTIAMHPMSGANYNRTTNYGRLGFDEFLDIDSFAGDPVYHAGVTDKSTYDEILSLLEENEEPQFIFDVTMQNHGGYAGGTVPAEDLVDYAPENLLGEDLSTQLNTYLTCIEASDRDLEYFIDELSNLDRPVVLIFFGDHQPNISAALNDALYPGEETFAHEMRTYESTYTVWANYEIEGCPVAQPGETSAAQLAAQTLYSIGAPLSEFQKAQLVLSSSVPAVNLLGYRAADGLRYELDAQSSSKEQLDQLQMIQYLNFARKAL